MFGGRYWGGRYFGARYWGKVGFTAEGAFWGGQYYAPRYWGLAYWDKNATSIPFALAVTNTVATSGVVTLGGGNLVFGADWQVTQVTGISVAGSIGLTGGSLSFDNAEWVLTPPIPLGQISGTVTVGGGFSINGPAPGYGGYWGRRYFGGRFWAERFWGSPETWSLTQTTGISATGIIGVAGGITTAIGFNPGTLDITGTIGLSGGFVVDGVADTIGRYGQIGRGSIVPVLTASATWVANAAAPIIGEAPIDYAAIAAAEAEASRQQRQGMVHAFTEALFDRFTQSIPPAQREALTLDAIPALVQKQATPAPDPTLIRSRPPMKRG